MKQIPTLFAAIGIAVLAVAQEQSVAPGINDNFREPDVQDYIVRFEGESRSIYAHRHDIVAALDLKPAMAVADVGAGTGFFSFLIADAIGDEGRVYAVDIAKNFIDHINAAAAEHKRATVEAILCTDRSAELSKNSVDLIFICDTYHHFEYPYDTLESLYNALRPGGRIAIVDFVRIEGVSNDWTLDHVRCGMGTVIDEVQQAGFDFVEKKDLGMADQYMITFVKREKRSEGGGQ